MSWWCMAASSQQMVSVKRRDRVRWSILTKREWGGTRASLKNTKEPNVFYHNGYKCFRYSGTSSSTLFYLNSTKRVARIGYLVLSPKRVAMGAIFSLERVSSSLMMIMLSVSCLAFFS